MDELTLGLIGAGAVVVGGVVVYNAWQGAKVRRKMPRPMPTEAEQGLGRHDHEEERPFIEPARAGVRREPALSDAAGDSEATRIEPSFGGVSAPLDIPADIQAEATTPNGFTAETASTSTPASAAASAKGGSTVDVTSVNLISGVFLSTSSGSAPVDAMASA